jgi:hypothetical protein
MHARSVSARAAVILLAALSVGLGACASTSGIPSPDAQEIALTTEHPVVVLDDGHGAELCVGVVAASLPPQCGGPALVGWDWSDHVGEYEQQAGIRWGDFLVTGRYDASADEFFPNDVVAAGEQPERPGYEPLGDTTPCPEPDGGWRVVDVTMTTDAARQAVFERAASIDGYSSAWVDQSRNPASLVDPSTVTDSLEWELDMNDPLLTIVNVTVVGDPAAAEAELRRVWGGMLCVSTAERSDAELQQVIDELVATTDGWLEIGRAGTEEHIVMLVVRDDGALQDRLDAEYGDGVVSVSSALVPVP